MEVERGHPRFVRWRGAIVATLVIASMGSIAVPHAGAAIEIGEAFLPTSGGCSNDTFLQTTSLGNEWETIFDRAAARGVTAAYYVVDLPVPLLYGTRGAKNWIHVFTALHVVATALFARVQGVVAVIGFAVGLLLLSAANLLIHWGESQSEWLRALPLFHAAMLVYMASLIADFFI